MSSSRLAHGRLGADAETYAGVEADALGIHAHVGELDNLLELDGKGRHDAGMAYYQVKGTVVKSILLSSTGTKESVDDELESISDRLPAIAWERP